MKKAKGIDLVLDLKLAFPAAELQESLALLLEGEQLRKRPPPKRTVDHSCLFDAEGGERVRGRQPRF